jgi:hypothetical protein
MKFVNCIFLILIIALTSNCANKHQRDYFKRTFIDYKKPKNWEWTSTDSTYTATLSHPYEHPGPTTCGIRDQSRISVYFKQRSSHSETGMINDFEDKISDWEIITKRQKRHKSVKSFFYYLQFKFEQGYLDKNVLIFYKHDYYVEVEWKTYTKNAKRTVNRFLRHLNVKKADLKDFF